MPFVVIFLILLVAAYLLFTNIRIVPEAHCYVIERLGRFRTVWRSGLHVKTPFLDRISGKVSMKEQVLDFPPQPVITKDNVTMSIDSVVYARIFDPQKYTYGVENPMDGLENLTATTLRNIIGEMELDQTLTGRDQINGKMQTILDEATDRWGLKVTRVEIKNINPPKEIEEVMTKQMRAERERRQTVLEAQAHQEAVVSRAEGDKKAKLLAAEAERDAQIALAQGRAKSIELVYQAEAEGLSKLRDADLDEAVLRLKGMEAMKDISDGQATKIFIPSDLAGMLSGAGMIGDMLGTSRPVQSVPRSQLRKETVVKGAEAKVSADPCLAKPVSSSTHSAAKANALAQKHLEPH